MCGGPLVATVKTHTTRHCLLFLYSWYIVSLIFIQATGSNSAEYHHTDRIVNIILRVPTDFGDTRTIAIAVLRIKVCICVHVTAATRLHPVKRYTMPTHHGTGWQDGSECSRSF